MVRWRYCLILAMLLLVPVITGPNPKEEDDEEGRADDSDDEEDDEEEEDDEATVEKVERPASPGRRAAFALTPAHTEVTRTVARRPLECYVCQYKADTQLKSCLDPTKYRIHTMICHSVDDRCFTSIVSKNNRYETVMRGCRAGCTTTAESTCCELNRCNNQALVLPTTLPPPKPRHRPSILQLQHRHLPDRNSQNYKARPSVLFFVTILLVLQTVVKVAFV